MAANLPNLDILTKSLGSTNTVKLDKNAQPGRESEQGDSFKQVIQRNEKTPVKKPVAEAKAASHKASKPETHIAKDTKANAQSEVEPTEQPSPKPTTDQDKYKTETPADTVSIDEDDTLVQEENAGEPVFTFIPPQPAAALDPRSGELLPLEPVVVEVDPKLSLAVDSTVNQQVLGETDVTTLNPEPLPIETDAADVTIDAENASPTMSYASNRKLSQLNELVDTGEVKLEIDGEAAEAELEINAAKTSNNQPTTVLPAPQSLVEVEGSKKFDAGQQGVHDLVDSDHLEMVNGLKTTGLNAQSGDRIINPQLVNNQRDSAPASLQGKDFSLEIVGDKAVTDTSSIDIKSQEAGFTVKTANAPVDQQWVQQFQTMQNLTAPGRQGLVQLQVPVNVHNPQWFAAMADRVSWLASQSIQAAEIHLDPPELGPMQVRIAINHEQASVNFVSHQPAVRDLLDSQLVRLRELFANEGLSLIDVNVSDRHQQQQAPENEGGQGKQNGGDDFGNEAPSILPVNKIQHWVDYYV